MLPKLDEMDERSVSTDVGDSKAERLQLGFYAHSRQTRTTSDVATFDIVPFVGAKNYN
jgi:hypothetical protein